jgi:hypothetical protein
VQFVCLGTDCSGCSSGWNRFAGAVVGDRFKTKVVDSAKFWAQLNYALANAAFAAWDTKSVIPIQTPFSPYQPHN